jgi:hypothetical protein
MLGFDSLLSGRQRIRHLLALEISFPELARKFDGSRIASVWITPGGRCSSGLSVDLGVDSSMDQVEIVLCQRDIRFPNRPQQQLSLTRRT